MAERNRTYFVSDVHLGLQAMDPEGREARFLAFLKSIPAEQTEALYMLGDIWDFWYEWKYVVPKGYLRIFAALQDLMDAGVNVYFCPGNHDVWAYGYFETLGIKVIRQPHFVTIGGKEFCVGHGDALGRTTLGYRILYTIFHSRVCQFLFSLLHPTIAMAIGHAWSRNNRLSRREEYVWKGEGEPLADYCKDVLASRHVDYFVFGHLHTEVRHDLPSGAKLVILDSWIYRDNYFLFSSL